jgi:predicted nucleic acid-binding Zn ribbon protein
VRVFPPFDSAQGDRDQVTSVEGDSTVRITRILTYKRKMDSRLRGNDGKEARSAKKWLATHLSTLLRVTVSKPPFGYAQDRLGFDPSTRTY